MFSKFRAINVLPVVYEDGPYANFSGIHYLTPRTVLETTVTGGKFAYGETQCDEKILPTLRHVANIPAGRSMNALDQIMEDVEAEMRSFIASRGWDDMRGGESFDKGTLRNARAGVFNCLATAAALEHGVPLNAFLSDYTGMEIRRDAVRHAFYGFFNPGTRRMIELGLNYRIVGEPESWEQVREQPAWDNIEDVVAVYLKARDEFGATSYKLKGGVFDPWYELKVMVALREALGPDVRLVYDPNSALRSVELAYEILTAMKRDADVTFVEDPVPGQQSMALVQKLLGKDVPLATNMCAPDLAAHITAKQLGSFMITLAGDIHYSGGMDRALEIARWCVENNIVFSNHSNFASSISQIATVHMVSLAPKHEEPIDMHGFYIAGRDVVENSVLPRDGVVPVPTAPGLGIDVDRARLLAAYERRQRLNSNGGRFLNRADRLAAQIYIQGWKPFDQRPADVDWWMMAGAPGYKRPAHTSL